MVIFGQILYKNTLILDKKLLKMTIVCQSCALWRSNQEWRSIWADTVTKTFCFFLENFNGCFYKTLSTKGNNWKLFREHCSQIKAIYSPLLGATNLSIVDVITKGPWLYISIILMMCHWIIAQKYNYKQITSKNKSEQFAIRNF